GACPRAAANASGGIFTDSRRRGSVAPDAPPHECRRQHADHQGARVVHGEKEGFVILRERSVLRYVQDDNHHARFLRKSTPCARSRCFPAQSIHCNSMISPTLIPGTVAFSCARWRWGSAAPIGRSCPANTARRRRERSVSCSVMSPWAALRTRRPIVV